jgi:hypothetical protein
MQIKAAIVCLMLVGCTAQPVLYKPQIALPSIPNLPRVQSQEWEQFIDCNAQGLRELYRKVAERDLLRKQWEDEVQAIIREYNKDE